MIFEVLGYGVENAKPGKHICSLLGISNRELMQFVENERRQGVPICAKVSGTNPGYYLARTRGEMQDYNKCLQRRVGELNKTLKACRKTENKLPISCEQIEK